MLLLFWICIFPFAPVHNRINVQNKINEEDKLAYCFVDSKRVLESPTNRNVALLSKEEKLKYIEKNYKSKRIYKHFILESYPYNYDPDFWYSILELPVSLRTDYRFLEEEMIKRIIEVNNNSYDKLFGISYTRLQNIFNIERDFIVQYYSVGIIGSILFLGIYFVMVVNILYFIFKKKLNNCFFALSLLCGSCVLLVVSYYSGNLLNSLMVTPYLCLSLGYAKKEVIEKE